MADGGDDDARPSRAKIVVYCGVCGLPPEFCSFGPDFEACKPWLAANCPELYPELSGSVAAVTGQLAAASVGDGAAAAAAEPPKPSGGKKKKVENAVTVSRSQRNKRKFVTTVCGLDLFGVKLAEASKVFSKKFSCGSSVVKNAEGKEEIDLQGDCKDEMVDLILEHPKWNIPKEVVFFLESGKRTLARP